MTKIPLTHSDKRLCKEGFFKSYLEYTDIFEGHEESHLWTAISLIATALGRKCYLSKGDWRIYPNLYVILVGVSALARKSSTMDRGIKLFRQAVGRRDFFSPKRATPALLINKIAEIYEKTKVSEIYMVSSEMSVFLGNLKQSDELVKLLTDIYDCPDDWDSGTMMRGIEQCNNFYPNLLAGTTPEWFLDGVTEKSMGGGFWSRLLTVCREPDFEKLRANPEDDYTEEIIQTKENLINDLKVIHRMEGQFKWTPDAKELWTQWYLEPSHSNPQDIQHIMKGYYGRKGTTLQKLCMIMSASKRNNRIIEGEDFMNSLALLNANEDYTNELIRELNMSDQGKQRMFILNIIKAKGTIGHSDLLRRAAYKYNAWMVNNILNALLQEHSIVDMLDPKGGGKKSYKFIQDASGNTG